MGFKTTHQAEIRVPQQGFTLDELKAHMRNTKVPVGARLKPAIVYTDHQAMQQSDGEVAFEAEWEE